MLIRSKLVALVLCIASGLSAQQAAKYDALLWRISGNGLAKPSHLYGTMHVSSKVAYYMSEEFFSALSTADMVALETDPGQWLPEFMSSPWIRLGAMATADGRLTDDLYHEAFKLRFPDRKRIASALARDPDFVNELMYRMTSGNGDHEENTFLDMFIYQCGRKNGKEVRGLERFEDSINQLVKAVTPTDTPDDPSRVRRAREAMRTGRPIEEQIEDSYRTQDLDRMDTLFDLSVTNDRMRQHVINERNETFIANLEELMRNRSVLAAVGALHLPGQSGMIEMLRAKGYTVEAVKGAVTSKSRGQQRKTEAMYLPVRWSMQWAPDSSFRMELPSTIHSVSLGETDVETLLATDAANGSHFMMQRVPTYAAIRGLSLAQVMAQVDSALYEGIPGRIEKMSRSSVDNGWPCVDVRSKDRMGRTVCHKVVVSPFELFVLEATLPDHADARKDAERSFASIRFSAPRTTEGGAWSPKEGGLIVDLPAMRHESVNDPRSGWLTEEKVERVRTVQAFDTKGDGAVLVISSFFPDLLTLEQDTFELNALGEETKKVFGLRGVLFSSADAGRRLQRGTGIAADGDTLHFLTAIDGDRYDLVCARGRSPWCRSVLDSYRSVPFSDVPLGWFNDTLLHFRTRSSTTLQKVLDEYEGLGDMLEKLIKEARSKKAQEHLGETRQMIYRSTHTPEAVRVDFERYHRFTTYPDEDEYWDDHVKSLVGEGLGEVRNRRMTGEAENRRVDLLITDTASARTIRVKMLQCPGALYTLRASSDREGRLTAWADSFFTAFTPDTTFSEGIFKPKGHVLLQWVTAGDSTQVRQARESFNEAVFADTDAKALMDYINSPAARDPKNGRRSEAIMGLGDIHHPGIVAFLRSQYTSAGDSSELQLTILQALASQGTREGAQAFVDLITSDPPLTDTEWMARNCFRPFFEKGAVGKHIFPKAWTLLSFREYEDVVVNLAAALVDSGYIGKTELIARKTDLLARARTQLKRAISAARQLGEGNEYDYDDEDPPGASYRNYIWGSNARLADETELIEEHKAGSIGAWSEPFMAYHHLLLPLRSDPEVAAYFNQALNCAADGVELPTAELLLEKGAPVPDAHWKRYAAREEIRLWTYRTLQANNRLDLFDAEQLGALANARAYLLSGATKSERDSTVLLGMRPAAWLHGKGDLHIFRQVADDDPDEPRWSLVATGFHTDGAEPFTDRFILNGERNLRKTEDFEKVADELAQKLRYKGRSRWREPNNLMSRFGRNDY